MPSISRWIVPALLALGAASGRASAQARDARAQIFVQRGCTECHAISGLHLKAAKDVGPDLTFAYGDVVHRYGVSLEAFLYEPRGLMRMMLASHIPLPSVDRDSMILILGALYKERRAELDSMPPP
jgi:mono/diheme cytochrome c family protein